MRDFTVKVSRKELALFLIPMILSGGFQSVYSLINTGVVSQYLSYEAVAMISACSGCVSLLNMVVSGAASGFGIFINRCIGSGDRNQVAKGFCGAVFLTCVMAAICLILSYRIDAILAFAGVPESLRAGARLYLRVILSGAGLLGMKNIMICTIQGFGNTMIPALISAVSVVTNTGLVVLLIAGLHFGVAASAFAIVLNNAWQVICMILYFILKYGKQYSLLPVSQIGLPVLKELIQNGISKASMFVLVAVGSFVMQRMENTLAVELLAGDAYADQIYGFFTEIISAYGTAAVVIAGQNMGSRNYGMIRYYMRRLIRSCMAWCAGMAALCIAGSQWMVRSLAGSEVVQETIHAGVLELRIVCWAQPLLAALIVYRYALQAMGEYRAMPTFGLLEMSVDIIMAMMISRIGYLAVCLAVMLKWTVPGIASIVWYQLHLRRVCQNLESEDGTNE